MSIYYNNKDDKDVETYHNSEIKCFNLMLRRGYGIVISKGKLIAWLGMTESEANKIYEKIYKKG